MGTGLMLRPLYLWPVRRDQLNDPGVPVPNSLSPPPSTQAVASPGVGRSLNSL
jgi:hypothetical protein